MCVSRKTFTLLLLVALLATLAVIAPLAPAKTLAPNAFGAKAFTYVDMLSRITKPRGTYTGLLRQAGTPSEVAAADKIAGWFGDAGLSVRRRCGVQTCVAASPTSQKYVRSLVVAHRPPQRRRDVRLARRADAQRHRGVADHSEHARQRVPRLAGLRDRLDVEAGAHVPVGGAVGARAASSCRRWSASSDRSPAARRSTGELVITWYSRPWCTCSEPPTYSKIAESPLASLTARWSDIGLPSGRSGASRTKGSAASASTVSATDAKLSSTILRPGGDAAASGSCRRPRGSRPRRGRACWRRGRPRSVRRWSRCRSRRQ